MNEQYIKDQGFVLKRIVAQNDDAYIIFYGREFGKIIALAKGVEKSTSKLSSMLVCGNCIEGEFMCTKSGYKLKSCSAIEGFRDRYSSYEALLTSVYMCDLVDKGVEREIPQEEIYHLLYFCFGRMDDKNFSEIRLYFAWTFLTLIGYGSEQAEYLFELFKKYWGVDTFSIEQQSIFDEILSFLRGFYSEKNLIVPRLSQNAYNILWKIIKESYQKQAQISLKSQKILEQTIGH